jgi:hypothetical protein
MVGRGRVSIRRFVLSFVLALICTAPLFSVCPTITVSPSALSVGTVGTSFSVSGSASGGATPYQSIVAAPNNPAFGGITFTPNLSSGAFTFSGTPTTSGFVNETVTATDANGCTGFVRYAYIVNPAACSSPITITPASLPAASQFQTYNATLNVSGGIGPYAVSVVGLPTGLTVDPNTHVISGIPTQQGLFELSVETLDTGSVNGCQGGTSYALTVGPPSAPATSPRTLLLLGATLMLVGLIAGRLR